MKMIKTMAVLAAISILGTSCVSTGSIDTQIQQSLPKACDAMATAYVGFSAIAATGKIKDATIRKVDAAYSGVQVLCINPERVTLIDAAIRVGQAYIVINAALKEAR